MSKFPGNYHLFALDLDSGCDARSSNLEGPCQLASVTKVISAIAIMNLIEERLLYLDEIMHTNLATAKHFLSHASGMSPQDSNVFLAPPGRVRIYSNAGYEYLINKVSKNFDIDFTELVTELVFNKIGIQANLRNPASSCYIEPESFEKLLLAILNKDLNISDSSFSKMISVAFENLPGMVPGVGYYLNNTWGLGFEIAGEKKNHWMGSFRSPDSYGHFGQSGAFVFIDPVAKIGICHLRNTNFSKDDVFRFGHIIDLFIAERKLDL